MSAENNDLDGVSSSSHPDTATTRNRSSGRTSTTSSDDGRDMWTIYPPIVNRVMALKKLLRKQHDIEKNFNIELHLLECKYNKYYMDIYNKRYDIVHGNYEPTDEECDFPSDDENYNGNDVSVDKAEVVKLTHSEPATPEVNNGSDQIKGIPNFWLTVLKNITLISNSIQPHDELILSHLTDIKIHLSEKLIGFTLEFYFSPNKWFTNTVLTKLYEMEFVKDKDNALDIDGLKITTCKGCTIQWNKGMDVTIKVVKKVKNRVVKMGEYPFQTVKKIIYNPSFFHFFSPPTMLDYGRRKIKRNIGRWLAADHEIGYYICERVVPRAVLYYTGEALIDIIDIDEGESESDPNEVIHASSPSNSMDEEILNRPNFADKCKNQ